MAGIGADMEAAGEIVWRDGQPFDEDDEPALPVPPRPERRGMVFQGRRLGRDPPSVALDLGRRATGT